MMNSLQNKNRTDLSIKTVKTSKETLNQFNFSNLFYCSEFIFPVDFFVKQVDVTLAL